jgi:hypothetical protein
MKASVAKAIAKAWVHEVGIHRAGFRAVHLSGSLTRLPEDAEFPDFSDIDLYCVMEPGAEFPQRKLEYRGAMLETVSKPLEDYASPETVLADPFLAPVFTTDCILSDPENLLAPLLPVVRAEYIKKRWLVARYEGVRDGVKGLAASIKPATTLDGAFATVGFTLRRLGILLAVAHLQVPTVRRSLANATRLLQSHGKDDLSDEMLRVLGCQEFTEAQARSCLQECVALFDRAVEVLQPPAVMEFNLVPVARPYLVEGAEEMIHDGQHREAMLWAMIVLWAANLCLQKDAPPDERPHWQERAERCYAHFGLVSMDAAHQREREAQLLIEQVVSYTDGVVSAYSEDSA